MRITGYAILVLAILFTLYSTTTASTTETAVAKETTQTTCDQPKSKLIVFVLSILLGSLGVDRFYAGFIALGIIKLAINIVSCGKKN
jgi:hypothetical protein